MLIDYIITNFRSKFYSLQSVVMFRTPLKNTSVTWVTWININIIIIIKCGHYQRASDLVTSATTRFVVCKYSIAIAPFTRLNFGTRTHFFGHGTPNFCRVNAKLRVRGPKILSGPRPPQEVVSVRLKIGPRTENLLRTRFVFHIAKILCLHVQTKYRGKMCIVRRSHIIQELRYILQYNKNRNQVRKNQ